MMFPMGLEPRPTEEGLWRMVLAVQRGLIEPEELEHLTEYPELPEDLTAEESAQSLAYDAYDYLPQYWKNARNIAEEALQLDPECVDALLCLWSLEGEGSNEALELARRAQESAEKKIARLPHWRRGIDDLWSHEPGCRGFVRAHAALAFTLRARGENREGNAMAERVISLNPTDNTGMRWHLVNWYLIDGAVRRAYRLLRDYPDEPFTVSLSAVALVEFLRSGPGKNAHRALMEAMEQNAALIALALVTRRADAPPPEVDAFTIGDVTETALWQRLLWDAWDAHPEAKEWAAEIVEHPDNVERTLGFMLNIAEQLGVLDANGLDGLLDLLGEDQEDER